MSLDKSRELLQQAAAQIDHKKEPAMYDLMAALDAMVDGMQAEIRSLNGEIRRVQGQLQHLLQC